MSTGTPRLHDHLMAIATGCSSKVAASELHLSRKYRETQAVQLVSGERRGQGARLQRELLGKDVGGTEDVQFTHMN